MLQLDRLGQPILAHTLQRAVDLAWKGNGPANRNILYFRRMSIGIRKFAGGN